VRAAVSAAVILCFVAWLLPITSKLLAADSDARTTNISSKRESVLVLNSGRIVNGRISQSALGYVVGKPNGHMLIPFEHVQLQAESVADAYRIMQSSRTDPSLADHLKLARWCITNQLHDAARQELTVALMFDSENPQTRRLLRRLEEAVHPEKPMHRKLPVAHQRTNDGFERSEAVSLAGLSRETARVYVRRVQPILMNRCANATCHGRSSPSNFHLFPVRAGRNSRGNVERNLAATLRQVDMDRPLKSPLLVVPQTQHDRKGRAVFASPKDQVLLETLRDWVQQLSKTPANATPEDSSKSNKDDTSQPNQERGILFRSQFPKTTGDPAAKLNAVTKTASKDDLLERVLRDERHDAFDPDVFNRAVHGAGRAAPKPASRTTAR